MQIFGSYFVIVSINPLWPAKAMSYGATNPIYVMLFEW